MIEVEGSKLYTEAEWERRHRHVKAGQRGKGVTRTWRATPGNVSATWYREDQTRPWSKADAAKARRAAKAKREEARKAKEEAERQEAVERARWEGAREARLELLRRCWGPGADAAEDIPAPHTAWQWIDRGLVPIDQAKWYTIDHDLGGAGRPPGGTAIGTTCGQM